MVYGSVPGGSEGDVLNDIPVIDRDGDAESEEVAAALLALNNAHAVELSWLTAERFGTLVSRAFLARRIGVAQAFLIAFDQSADYDGVNFVWFRDRIERFVYVDRVVVGEAFRALGHARRLYEDLFRRAKEAGHDRVACEVNADPPNSGSDRFHAAMGFEAIGAARLADRCKTVTYLARRL